MLNKLNLGLAALVLGFGLTITTSAFKSAKVSEQKRDQYRFVYNPPSASPYSVANVTNTSHWSYAPDSEGCSGEERACSIVIDQAYVDLSATPALKPSANLTASFNAPTSTAYVTGSADGLMQIENSDQP